MSVHFMLKLDTERLNNLSQVMQQSSGSVRFRALGAFLNCHYMARVENMYHTLRTS